jgi:apolipoprotein N-acyltransferase
MDLMQSLPAFSWCLLSSLLLWLSFFPVNLGWLGWVALIPLVFVLQDYINANPVAGVIGCKTVTPTPSTSSPMPPAGPAMKWFHRPLLSAWLGGLVFCLIAFRWIVLASTPMIAVYIALALIISLQWYFFFLFTKLVHLRLKLPLFLAAACVWTALEYIRSQIWIGYSWYYLGHTQHDELTFIQIADLTGVFGISFIMVMVNVALARVIIKRSFATVTWELFPAIVLVGVACWYGSQQMTADAEHLNRPQTPRIAILQGNQPQDLRNDPNKWREIDEVYFKLGDAAAQFNPELIVAPETCISVSWIRLKDNKLPTWLRDLDPKLPPFARMAEHSQHWAELFPGRWKADLFFGFNSWDLTGDTLRHNNSAILINKQGREVGHYDKIVCLPFGEYIPWAETLPFMKWLSPYPYEYTVRCGETVNSIPWKNYRLGTLICYEDSAHDLCREFMLKVNPSFWMNISNDGWFKGSEEHEQHLVSARFRCIETRRSMVRAVNMGVSCIIDGMGRLVALPTKVPVAPNDKGAIPASDLKSNSWFDAKNREGILIGTVPLYEQISFYTRYGDLLPLACWAVMILAWVLSVTNRSKTP